MNFESAHVRPLCLSPSGALLFAVNTPDNRLEVFSPESGTLRRRGEVVVGLEPVAVAARSEREVYVANHVSDSVSVVDAADPDQPFVKATLLVGDEPRGLTLAGKSRSQLVVAAARRGQNCPPAAGAEEVLLRSALWIFAVDALDAPPRIVPLGCDSVRAVASSPDGRRVYAAAFLSGNRTTVVPGEVAAAQPPESRAPGAAPSPPPPHAPHTPAPSVPPPPATSVIVQAQGSTWLDADGRDRTRSVTSPPLDNDLFFVDLATDPPQVTSRVSGVGTVLFNLAVGPAGDTVYVTNIDAHNLTRYERKLRGRVVENRVTLIQGPQVLPVDLNPHIDHEVTEGRPEDIELSLALPVDIEVDRDGSRLYLCAMASGTIAVLDRSGRVARRIPVGGTPTGLALHENARRLYVLESFLHTLLVIDLASDGLVEAVPLRYSPEPQRWRLGRQYLYDGRASAHGDTACGSCHVFGDVDGLVWDLGDPGGEEESNPLEPVPLLSRRGLPAFHPLKGPMRTLSLRGLAGAGAMHWRGDRNGGPAAVHDTHAAFLAFRQSFQSLLGSGVDLPVPQMEKLHDFALSLRYPPNPVAALDGALTPAEAAGRDRFLTTPLLDGADGARSRCVDCHELPIGTAGLAAEVRGQSFKVPHLRGLYRQTRFGHDGSTATLSAFLSHPREILAPARGTRTLTPAQARELEAFLLAFPTGLAPAVGQQVTLGRGSPAAHWSRFTLLEARAQAGDGDLVLHGRHEKQARGWLLDSSPAGAPAYRADRANETVSAAALRQWILAGDAILTATLVPPGSGLRMALDRDEDGVLDGDERASGSDPGDRSSRPASGR